MPDPKIITKFRKRHNISQYRLGQLLEVPFQSVQQWEFGTHRVPTWLPKMLALLEKSGEPIQKSKVKE